MSVVLLSLAIAGLIGYGVWVLTDNTQVGAGPLAAPVAISSPPLSDRENVAEPAAFEIDLGPYLPAPDSMQARLLSTTEGNRNNILSLAISSDGYECPQIRTAKEIGSYGSLWRVQCGETRVYTIAVGEFGRLRVSPVPYGDIQGFETPVRREFESGERTIVVPPEE